jgi:DegV family protein with EDD domain
MEVYDRLLAGTTEQIVSLHLSSKLSGTYDAAVTGRELSAEKARITVIDTLSLSMGLGFCVLVAARLAQSQAELHDIIQAAKETTSLTRISATFDTLKYVLKSGRLGAAKALIGGILNVKPLLTLKDGVLWPSGISRTRHRALDSLVDFAKKTPGAEEAAIVYSTTPDEALDLKEKLSEFMDQSKIYISRLGPALGAHGGPGTIILAVKRNLANG